MTKFDLRKKISKHLKRTKNLLETNKQAIRESNITVLKKVMWIGVVLSFMAFLFGFLRKDMGKSQFGYLACSLSFLLMIIIFRGKVINKFSILGLYLVFTIFYALIIYLSCYVFTDRYAATALTFFCVIPLVYVDKTWRKHLFVIILYILLIIVSYFTKGKAIAGVDAINCAVSMLIGLTSGGFMLQDRLNYFESERLLNFERDTDVLTTLANRRSMYDQMKQIESGKAEIPSGVLMIDIDHFKIFNDTYGHEAGDKCLHSFGSFLKSKSSESILFYRFGGEEFVAFLYDFTKENIADFAILLCKETSDLDTGVGKMTISIGGVYCYDKTKNNLEYWIDLADQASYEAKHKGRNTVVMSDSYIQSLKLDINEWESE